jgi:D-hydroxyproline dehydrogenase subunit alpha
VSQEPSTVDLLIVGAGPAGLVAARCAADLGLTVLVVDERPIAGGQIYKQLGPGFQVTNVAHLGRDTRAGMTLIDEVAHPRITVMNDTSVLAIRDGEVVVARHGESTVTVNAQRLLIAPGAHDRPVVFPGWTLPGVITAGGAQTLVKTQRVLPGESILFAGSGPLALAFPAQLRSYGANIVMSLEAGPAPGPGDLVRLALAARGNVHLLADAARYRGTLLRHRVPLRYRRIVTRAGGTDRLEYVEHSRVDDQWNPIPGTMERLDVDTLIVGYGFFPSVEAFRLAGCTFGYDEELGGPVVDMDEEGRTSVPHVFAAGDGAGVEGVYVAMAQARIAALAAAADLGHLTKTEARTRMAPQHRSLARKRKFAQATRRMFTIGSGVYGLASPDTVVCRCENITQAQIDTAVAATPDISAIKNYTRAGMGMCQGRNCQRHIAATISARHGVEMSSIAPATARFPLRPVPLSSVADDAVTSDKFFTVSQESSDA